jgi:uncharacterized protein
MILVRRGNPLSLEMEMKIKVKKRETLMQILERTGLALFPAGTSEEISVFSRDCDGDSPLHKAALWGDRHAIELLVDAGADVDAEGDMKCTPLDYAVMSNHVLAAEKLLDLGASPAHKSEFGSSPRDRALDSGDREMISLFRSKG